VIDKPQVTQHLDTARVTDPKKILAFCDSRSGLRDSDHHVCGNEGPRKKALAMNGAITYVD